MSGHLLGPVLKTTVALVPVAFLLMLVLGKIEGGGEGDNRGQEVGWRHQLNGHEFEQTLGDSGGQGSLACCSPWGPKELNMTELLNNKAYEQTSQT